MSETLQQANLREATNEPLADRAVVRTPQNALAARLEGQMLLPDDDAYDSARAVWNGRIHHRPALIVRAAGARDVMLAVNYAREHALLLSVRAGGHHSAGLGVADHGVMLDLSGLKQIEIDTEARTARVAPGVTAGEFMSAIHARGLICTIGSHGTVGMSGLTLGGGIGLLMGRYGLVSDNLLAAEIVTADGRLRTVSARENPDLFWALRGGGGNFGVVTSLTFRLHPVEPTLAGIVAHPVERTAEVLRFYREFAADLPDSLSVFPAIIDAPNGMRVCALMACQTGDPEEGRRLMAPLKAFGPPLMDTIQPAPYTSLLALTDHSHPAGIRASFSSHGVMELTDEVVDTIAAFATEPTWKGCECVIYHQHGAAVRPAADATAYGLRGVPYLVGIYAAWERGNGSTCLGCAARFRAALRPHTTGAGYLNLMDETGQAAVRASYGANYERLAAIKSVWDPGNLFRHNQNIRPERSEFVKVGLIG